MKTKLLLGLFLLVCFVGVSRGTMTVATFWEPSNNSEEPLFAIDWDSGGGSGEGLLTGGWSGSGLNLEMYTGIFTDVVFEMSDVVILTQLSLDGRKTGSGTVKFYKSSDAGNPSATPIFQIDFAEAWLNFNTFGQTGSFLAGSVVFSGSELAGSNLSDEEFSFNLTNREATLGNWQEGFTATSSFTSSAIPEPATLGFLVFGTLLLYRRR